MEKEDNFIRLNVALIPPKFVAEKAIELSQKLGQKFETHFVLDGVQFNPHITVYSPEFPEKNLEKILEAVRSIAANAKSLKLRGDRFETEQGFIGVGLDLTEEVRKFHEQIVAALNPLREDHRRPKYDADYMKKLSPEKIANIEKYGYGDLMNLYRPHLTITRLKEEPQAEEISYNLKWDILEFDVCELGVFKMGEHGTCRELVEEFGLN